MFETKRIKESLSEVTCYKCGKTLEGARLTSITEASVVLVACAVCKKCQAQNMITITPVGTGSVPLMSDLSSEEIGKFINLGSISYDEILEFHKELKKKSLWSLLQKKEQPLARKRIA